MVSRFTRFVSDWKRSEHYGCSFLHQTRAANTDGTRTSSPEISEINFVDHYAKSHQFDVRQTLDSHQKHRTRCFILTFAHSPDKRSFVTLSWDQTRDTCSLHYDRMPSKCPACQRRHPALYGGVTVQQPGDATEKLMKNLASQYQQFFMPHMVVVSEQLSV